MLTSVYCPERNVPAEITDRVARPSTGGPVGHVRLLCAGGCDVAPYHADYLGLQTCRAAADQVHHAASDPQRQSPPYVGALGGQAVTYSDACRDQ